MLLAPVWTQNSLCLITPKIQITIWYQPLTKLSTQQSVLVLVLVLVLCLLLCNVTFTHNVALIQRFMQPPNKHRWIFSLRSPVRVQSARVRWARRDGGSDPRHGRRHRRERRDGLQDHRERRPRHVWHHHQQEHAGRRHRAEEGQWWTRGVMRSCERGYFLPLFSKCNLSPSILTVSVCLLLNRALVIKNIDMLIICSYYSCELHEQQWALCSFSLPGPRLSGCTNPLIGRAYWGLTIKPSETFHMWCSVICLTPVWKNRYASIWINTAVFTGCVTARATWSKDKTLK